VSALQKAMHHAVLYVHQLHAFHVDEHEVLLMQVFNERGFLLEETAIVWFINTFVRHIISTYVAS
jgi:hypothetical protein